MRNISRKDRVTIYLHTAPFLLGEAFCIVGFIMPFFAVMDLRALGGLLFLAIGIYFVKKKMDTAKLGYYVLRHGVKSIAEITRITNTNTEHNERTI